MNKLVLRVLLCCAAGAALGALPAGCKKPQMPSLYGEGRFHDITQIRIGAGPNEVERIMGSKYKTIWEEGIKGADMGLYAWEYPEGRVYFNTNGVYKVVPYR